MKVEDIKIEDFVYELPDERIAKYPLVRRDECLLLVSESDTIRHNIFKELPSILPSNSVLVYNNSRVINARLRFRKGENEDGSVIEIFCLEPVQPTDYAMNFAATDSCSWKCFVGNSKRWKEDTILKKTLTVDGKKIEVKAARESRTDDNASIVRFSWDDASVTFSQIIETMGEIPIPPYLNRKSEKTDATDYQTVYSKSDGSVAAPTAGLHFTEDTLSAIDARQIPRREVTLHVGAGTFQPVNGETIGEHSMHQEFFSVSRRLIEELIEWLKEGSEKKRVIAVGTTSVRTLESLYYVGCLLKEGKWEGIVPQWYPYDKKRPELSAMESFKQILEHLKGDAIIGETRLLIAPGYKFKVVEGMVTNFHQPGSTLLLLISAFLGRKDNDWQKWRCLYNEALAGDYRFLSYGDACLFL